MELYSGKKLQVNTRTGQSMKNLEAWILLVIKRSNLVFLAVYFYLCIYNLFIISTTLFFLSIKNRLVKPKIVE